jgi:ribosome-interacting GTPase 1
VGTSARFDGQRVGREHELADGDAVEIITRG